MQKTETPHLEKEAVANLLEEQVGCRVYEIWQADPKNNQALSRGSSAHAASQYFARVEYQGQEMEVSFFVKQLTREELEKELMYVAAFKSAGLQALTYKILAHTPIDKERRAGTQKYLLITETIPGLEPLSHIIGFETAEDGTVLSERGPLDPEIIEGVLTLFTVIHTQFYFIHGGGQPKNFNIVRDAIIRSRFVKDDMLSAYRGVKVIDFEQGRNLNISSDVIMIEIARDLESFLSYIEMDDRLMSAIKDMLTADYDKFLSAYGLTGKDLIAYLEDETTAFS